VASYFAIELEKHGIDGSQLRAMVFLLIAITVLSAGLTGGFVAKLLGLKRQSEYGWVILGANAVGRRLAATLQSGEKMWSLLIPIPAYAGWQKKMILKSYTEMV
jgi:hypothetical protein